MNHAPTGAEDQVQELMRLAAAYADARENHKRWFDSPSSQTAFVAASTALETAIRAALAPPAATAVCAPAGLPNRILDAAAVYWGCAFKEGQENRQHDTPSGDAADAWEKLRQAILAYGNERASPAASTAGATQDLGVSAPSSPPGSLSQAPTIPDASVRSAE